MSKCIIVGDFRSISRPYTISKLCLLGSNFTSVFIEKVNCTSISIAKYCAPNKVGHGNVAVIKDDKGNVFYYHPRYRRWYKNLSDESIRKYFLWLLPVIGQ